MDLLNDNAGLVLLKAGYGQAVKTIVASVLSCCVLLSDFLHKSRREEQIPPAGEKPVTHASTAARADSDVLCVCNYSVKIDPK